jgi:DNA-binding winged helix-turn-helix (wHTH) protein/Tol biopolymer transport system component
LPVSETPSLLRFGTFELDVRSGELRRNGTRIRLQDQPFQVLLTLLDSPGEIVTREELHTKLWPADTFVDFDHGLNAAVKRLRDALGDTADDPRYIETLARKGYRFVAPVTSNKASTQPSLAPPSVTKNDPSRQRRFQLFAAAAVILLIGSLAGWLISRSFRPVWPTEQRLTANPSDLPIIRAVISPDGKTLAYADRTGLFLREIASGEAHAVSLPDKFRAVPTAWFPDGTHLVVTKLPMPGEMPSVWSVSVLGGTPRMLVDDAWVGILSADASQLAFSRGDKYSQSIWIEPTAGGEPRRILDNPEEMIGAMAWSADGKHLAFIRRIYSAGYVGEEPSIMVASLADGKLDQLLSNPSLEDALAWSSDGRLIYSQVEPPPNTRESNLWTLSPDPQSGRPSGNPSRLTIGPDLKTLPSLSSDGKTLAFLRQTAQAEIYIGELSNDLRSLASAKRLILEEGTNRPYAWTADSQSVIFISDRDGSHRLFRQTPSQGAPELVGNGDDHVVVARMNPSGSAILYSVVPPGRMETTPMSLMSIPTAGGRPRLLFKENAIANFQCARLPSNFCLIGRVSATSLTFSSFDSETGAETEVMWLERPKIMKFNWSLSPDGSQLVMAEWMDQVSPAEITLLSIKDKSQRTIHVEGWSDVRSLDWAADGQSIWIGAANTTGTQALLRVDLKGNARPFVIDDEHELGWAIPSPDGRRIAYWKATGTSNAWMLHGF